MSKLRLLTATCALIVCVAACSEPEGPLIEVREIQSELLFRADSWHDVSSPPGLAPYVDRIVPSLELAREKEDLPSLILSPPSSLSLPLSQGRGERVLCAEVGIDRSASAELPEGQSLTVGFRVQLDGQEVWQTELELEGASGVGAGWIVVGDGEEGLPLGDASELTISTRVVRGVAPDAPLKLGFGRLRTEAVSSMALERASPEKPNVVFVVMDTLRADRTSVGGYAKDTTPRLSALAERGVTWSGAHSTCSWTWPSTASMLTGFLPEEHGVSGIGSSYLSSELDTLAEVMQRRGLATAAFVGNPLVVASQNFDQGFQHFQGTRAGIFVDGRELVPPALDWIREHKDSRFFLYLHMVDPHVPNDPAPEVVGRFGRAEAPGWDNTTSLSSFAARMMRGSGFDKAGRPRYKELIKPAQIERMQSAYDECVWTGDKWFGRVLDELESLGLSEETVVVLTSDHGEELLDHGLLKHAHSLYDELVRVPLVIAGPGIARGVRSPRTVSNRSVFGTLAAIAGGPFEGPGVDLRDPGGAKTPAAPVFYSTIMGFWNGVNHLQVYGVAYDGWTLHFAPEGGPFGATKQERLASGSLEGKLRLFHVADDPGQQLELSAAEPERAAELLALIQERLVESSKHRVTHTLASGDGTLDMLKAIGYIDGADDE